MVVDAKPTNQLDSHGEDVGRDGTHPLAGQLQ
jgi:hypothetical protein